jgi:hypothetical protein
MKTNRLTRRRLAAGIGAIAIVAMGTLSACAGEQKKEEPTTTTTTTTTAPSVTPTEKGINPTGGNKFTPSVKAPTPATAIPGDN